MKNLFIDKRGNVAVTFAIVLLPLLSAIGGAVDISRASSAKTAMQAALDSATLMVSKEMPGLTAAQITQKTQLYFSSLVSRPELKGLTITANYTTSASSGSSISASASGTMNTEFLRVAGFPTLALGVLSNTTWGNTRARIALALDTTGSMKDDGKLAAMQSASKRLIDQLSGNATVAGDVYVSLVPFADYVNVNKSNYAKPWFDWSGWNEVNGDCTINGGDKTQTKCMSKGGVWTPDNHSTWNGCVTDRDEDYDVKKTPPGLVDASTQFQPEQATCPVPIIPLTYDWASLKARIDQMTASGATNQPVGMAWAWLSLQPTEPLKAPAEDSGFEYKKYLIVLSDGLNTKNKKSGNGVDHSAYVDGRQKLLCDNIKADGITVYAVQVNTDKDPESSILKYCASGSDNFFMLTSASQITSAFDAIGTKMSKLRVSK
jgi:hypothetical protein